MMNFRSIAEKLAQADTALVNRIRMLAISMCSLVFAVALYHYMFGAAAISPSARSTLALAPYINFNTCGSGKAGQSCITGLANPLPAGIIVKQQTVSPMELSATPVDEGDSDQAVPTPASFPPEKNTVIPESTMQYMAPPDSSASFPVPSDISAKAVFVSDDSLETVLYEKNADRELPEASLTKLMTAVVVREHTKQDDVVEITKDAVDTEGIAGNLRAGEQFTVADLLKVMLVVSSNDAAVAFQEHLAGQGLDLVALMNEKAKELGMEHTYFMNVDGLDAQGHHTTARDLAKLVSFSLHDDALWNILSERSDSVRSLNKKIPHQLLSTNELLQHRIAGVKGGKTGYTQNALGCMITATDDGHIIIVLGSQDRFSDTKALVTFVQKSL